MKITYLSSPITSQYGGGEKFLDDFTTNIDAEHEFIGSSKAIHDLFQSKGYKATLNSGLFEPVSPRNLLLFPISMCVGLFQFIHFYKAFQSSDWIISPTSHCETFFVIPYVKLFLRKPVMFMVHSAKVPKVFQLFPFNWLLSKCWGKSLVTFVSSSQKTLWNNAGCNSTSQSVIYNGVQTSELKPKLNDDKTIKIGFLGRLHSDKGCDILLESLSSVKSQEQIEVIIGGDGPEKTSLLSKLASIDLPINITVRFVGFVSDTKSFLESLDLFVFPSRTEGFSLVLLECYERGISPLTSSIKPFLEAKQYFDKAEQSLIFKTDDNKELASKIDYFIENQGQYLDLEYKKRLHSVIVEKFSLEQMLSEYNKVLNS